MEAALPASPIFGGRKYTVMSFSTLSDAKCDMDRASQRFLKAKELKSDCLQNAVLAPRETKC